MNGGRIPTQCDIGGVTSLLATIQLASDEQKFRQVGVFREVRARWIVARDDDFEMIAVGNEFSNRTPCLAGGESYRQHERDTATCLRVLVRQRNE